MRLKVFLFFHKPKKKHSFDIHIGSSIIYFEFVWLFIDAFFALSLSVYYTLCYVGDGCFFLICSHSFGCLNFWHKFKLNWMDVYIFFIRAADCVTFETMFLLKASSQKMPIIFILKWRKQSKCTFQRLFVLGNFYA